MLVIGEWHFGGKIDSQRGIYPVGEEDFTLGVGGVDVG